MRDCQAMNEADLVSKIVPALTNAPVSNATVAALSQQLMQAATGPKNPIYYFVDAGIYLGVFLLMTVVVRLFLRTFAHKEADNTKVKAFAGTLVVLLLAAAVAGAGNTLILLAGATIPATLIATLFLRSLFWISFVKALGLAIVILVSGAGLTKGVMAVANTYMPPDRVALMQRVMVSLKFLDDFHGKEGEATFTTNFVKTLVSGMSVQKEAWLGAIELLRNPNAIKELTAEHEADLRALDLITDGKMPSPEELLELGVTDDELAKAQPGLKFLSEMESEKPATEQDVAAVAAFLKTIRKSGDADVSAADVAVVIREALKKREAEKLQQQMLAASADAAALPDIWGDETNELWESSFQFMGPMRPADFVKHRVVALASVDPFAGMASKERAEWFLSRTLLDVTAYFNTPSDAMVLVNGQIVRTGGVHIVKSSGRSYGWRLERVGSYSAEWSPVITTLAGEFSIDAPGR